MNRFALARTAAFTWLAALPALALAHPGHGEEQLHWHATDTWGFIVTLALVAAAVWFGRRK